MLVVWYNEPMEIVFIIIALAIAISVFRAWQSRSVASEPRKRQASTYMYTKKQFIMTKAENEFYQVLQDALGSAYMVYPQAHVDLFLDHKVKG